ncbi:MAG TPA: hypothetical protein VGL97_12325 [Bryobacteraceae bacterium]|jgi:hypothetical protein
MPFANSCFISYRHSCQPQTRKIISQTVDALKAELDLRVPLEVFRDVERLQGGEFYNEALASNLCGSVCMVMLYWPTYFSTEHTFCSREYHAMLRWEAERLARLPNPLERQKGLIVIVAFRDFNQIPAEITSNRLVYNFEAHSMRPNMTQRPEFKKDINKIGTYISERCRAFDAVPPPDPCLNCPQCKLPPAQEILPWLQRILHPGVPYPTREGDR